MNEPRTIPDKMQEIVSNVFIDDASKKLEVFIVIPWTTKTEVVWEYTIPKGTINSFNMINNLLTPFSCLESSKLLQIIKMNKYTTWERKRVSSIFLWPKHHIDRSHTMIYVTIPSIPFAKARLSAILQMTALMLAGVHQTPTRKDLATKEASHCAFIIVLSTKRLSVANYYYWFYYYFYSTIHSTPLFFFYRHGLWTISAINNHVIKRRHTKTFSEVSKLDTKWKENASSPI